MKSNGVNSMNMDNPKSFTPYQKLIIALIALTQFTIILDFMVLSPLGDFLIKGLDISTTQFGLVVSAYAFSAGISGLLTAGFADRYDRKKLLLFFYIGFIAGTLLCGMAHSYPVLLLARIVTGLFGGVIGSISMAIITDLFPMEQRGRTMGFIQMGFGASQVLGIPISLYLANHWGWQSPFLMVVGIAAIIAILLMVKMQPVTKHLALQHDRNAVKHLMSTLVNRQYRIGYTATAFLSIGGFMMMPFGSAFAINNLHVTPEQLPLLFMVSGLGALVIMPLVGRLSDRFDKLTLLAIASVYMMVMVVIYTNLTPQPLWVTMVLNVMMLAGILSRMVPSTALVTAVPEMQDRGAFMSVNSSLQQIAGGLAAAIAGMIVVQKDKFSPLEHYNTLGYVMVGITALSIWLTWRVSKLVKAKMQAKPVSPSTTPQAQHSSGH
jgi:predicted MFS family arabinose efflux permease